MTTLVRATLGDIVVEVIRLCGDRVEKSTATAGAASTITFGNLPVLASPLLNDKYLNKFLYLFKGTSAGDERVISLYVGITRIASVPVAFTATPTATTEFIITEKRRPLLYEDAVKTAIRRAAYLFNRPLTDTSLRVGNILPNGHFEFWDNASNVATGTFIYTLLGGSRGWAVRGTGAVGVRIGGPGSDYVASANQDPYTLYGGRMTSDGTNAAFFEQAIPEYYRYLGKTMTVKGNVKTGTASRVNIRILDGVNTFTSDTGGSSGTHSGTSTFQELSRTDFVLSTAATQLTVELRTSAGAAVTADWDDVRLIPAVRDYVHIIPPWFEYVSQVYLEKSTPGLYYPNPLPKEDYRIRMNSSGFMTLSFDKSEAVDRHIMLVGGGYRTDTIAVTTNIEFPPQLIVDMAVMEVLSGAEDGNEQRQYAAARDRVLGFLGREKFQKLEAGHAV